MGGGRIRHKNRPNILPLIENFWLKKAEKFFWAFFSQNYQSMWPCISPIFMANWLPPLLRMLAKPGARQIGPMKNSAAPSIHAFVQVTTLWTAIYGTVLLEIAVNTSRRRKVTLFQNISTHRASLICFAPTVGNFYFISKSLKCHNFVPLWDRALELVAKWSTEGCHFEKNCVGGVFLLFKM